MHPWTPSAAAAAVAGAKGSQNLGRALCQMPSKGPGSAGAGAAAPADAKQPPVASQEPSVAAARAALCPRQCWPAVEGAVEVSPSAAGVVAAVAAAAAAAAVVSHPMPSAAGVASTNISDEPSAPAAAVAFCACAFLVLLSAVAATVGPSG